MSIARITFGCVPHTDDSRTRGLLVDLCSWLSDSLAVHVAPHRSASPRDLATAFAGGDVDVAWVSPALFLTARELEPALPIACSVRAGMSTYHGVLFVQVQSRFRSPSDLAGTRAAWVAPTSASGYIVQRLALGSHGLDPRTLFTEERFYESHHEVARAVFDGRADVGATFALFEDGNASRPLLRAGYLDVVPGVSGRILYAAGPVPSDLIVASPSVPRALRERLARALATLQSADDSARLAIGHILGADTFEAPAPRAFDALREQIADGRALGLLDELPSERIRIPAASD